MANLAKGGSWANHLINDSNSDASYSSEAGGYIMRKLLIMSILIGFLYSSSFVSGQEEEPVLRIYGTVEEPLNITYSQFLEFPMVSVDASVICVGAPPEALGANSYEVYTYNWTGVRVTELLEIAGITDSAMEVVFRDNTRYSSSLTLEELDNPDIILAIYADGETLNRAQGYPFRLVAPCYWGYKWVKYVERMEVVDYDYKGFWESHGYPDEALIPDCTYTTSNPQVFTSISQRLIAFGIILVVASILNAGYEIRSA
ncbi:molybdopterin-dependent oxidoreductase [Candidatus Bathyarchaeota archaeon]|nr:molybdopterin-dependent oxidoreductase [Candidatus Bathyarchaeota archaeon]